MKTNWKIEGFLKLKATDTVLECPLNLYILSTKGIKLYWFCNMDAFFNFAESGLIDSVEKFIYLFSSDRKIQT